MSKKWFQDWWQRDGFLILDSETTGLDGAAEIVQLGIVDKAGVVLFDSLIRPTVPISTGAARVHGITELMLIEAPTLADVYWQIRTILEGRDVLVYNASFDKRLLAQSCRAHNLDDVTKFCSWGDVMVPYAEYWGEWNDYRQDNKWQSLTSACVQQSVQIVDAHSAVGDCLMTLALLRCLGEVVDRRL